MASDVGDMNFLQQTPERTNFYRLTTLLIVGGKEMLKNLLEKRLPPRTKLQDFLNDPLVKSSLTRHLTSPQKQLLYPPPGTAVGLDDLDISLLFKLLRNTCGLIAPLKGWDDLPDEKDDSLEADLARIKFYRNSVYGHCPDMAIPADQFYCLWTDISTALVRIAGHIGTLCKSRLHTQIGKLMSEAIDLREVKDQIETLTDWFKEDIGEMKKILETVHNTSQVIQNDVETLLKQQQVNLQKSSNPSEYGNPNVSCQQYRPTYNKTVVMISNQTPNQSAISPQVERTAPLTSPTQSQQNGFTKTASTPSTAVARRMEYTRQFGHEESIKAISSNVSVTPLINNTTSTSNVMHGNVQNQSTANHYTPNLESFPAPPHALSPSHETKKYQDSHNAGEPSDYCGAARYPNNEPTTRQSFYPGDLVTSCGTRHNGEIGGSGETTSVGHTQKGYLTIFVRCKVIQHRSYTNLHVKESQVIQFVKETYLDLQSSHPSQFLGYLQQSMELTVERVHVADKTCTVEVSSTNQLAIDKLWKEYTLGNLREITNCTLITQEVLDKFSVGSHCLTVQLEAEIDAEEYKDCCMSFHAQGYESTDQRSRTVLRPRSLFNPEEEEKSYTQKHERSKSVDAHQSAFSVPSESDMNNAAQELYKVICKSGGSLRLQTALSKLSKESQDIVNIFHRDSVDAFVKRFKDLFTVNDDGGTVDAIVNIRFCKVTVEQERGCNNKNCTDLHLCPFDIEGKCMYRHFCKRSHDVNDAHTTYVLSLHGLEMLTDRERYKLFQKMTADPKKRVEWMAPTNKLPKICTFYNNPPGKPRCKKGDSCSFLHVCRHWILDDCRYDRLCYLAHEFDANHEVNILERHNIGHLLEDELRKILREADAMGDPTSK